MKFLILSLCIAFSVTLSAQTQTTQEKVFSYEFDCIRRDSFFLIEKAEEGIVNAQNPRPTATYNHVLFDSLDKFWLFVESLKTEAEKHRKEAEKIDAMRLKIESAADGNRTFFQKKKN